MDSLGSTNYELGNRAVTGNSRAFEEYTLKNKTEIMEGGSNFSEYSDGRMQACDVSSFFVYGARS